MAKSKEVATTEDTGAVPAYLQGHTGGSGLSGLTADDLRMPRLKLLQGTSEECTTFDDAKPGAFWHNLLDQPVEDGFTFTVLGMRKKYLLMTPINDPRGILARADDAVHWNPPNETFQVTPKGLKKPVEWTTAPTVAESGLHQFGSSDPNDPDSPPAATLFFDYLIKVDGLPGAMVMSLARTGVRAAKDLNSKIEMAGVPVQAQRFKCYATQETGDDGSYAGWRFARAGYVDEATFKINKEMSERYADFTVTDEVDSGDVAPATTDEPKEF